VKQGRVCRVSRRGLFVSRNDQNGQAMGRTGVAVERTADFVAPSVHLPMRDTNGWNGPVVLAPGGEAARKSEQVGQSVDPRGRGSLIACESDFDLCLGKYRRFVCAFCRICPLVAAVANP
jgi:hypothetical protein